MKAANYILHHLKNNIQNLTFFNINGRVAQRITRLPTEQKIAGSSPAVVGYFSIFVRLGTYVMFFTF